MQTYHRHRAVNMVDRSLPHHPACGSGTGGSGNCGSQSLRSPSGSEQAIVSDLFGHKTGCCNLLYSTQFPERRINPRIKFPIFQAEAQAFRGNLLQANLSCLYLSIISSSISRKYRALVISATLPPTAANSLDASQAPHPDGPACSCSTLRFCLFVRPAFFFQISARGGHSGGETCCRSANTSLYRVCKGLTPSDHQFDQQVQPSCANAQHVVPGAPKKRAAVATLMLAYYKDDTSTGGCLVLHRGT